MTAVPITRRVEAVVAASDGPVPTTVMRALTELSRHGMAVAVVGDSDEHEPVAEGIRVFRSVDVALDALERLGIHASDVAVLDHAGGWRPVERLVADQLRRRKRGELPPGDVDPLWCVVLDGFDPDLERTREALLSLANGSIGIGGATLASHPTQRRWVLVNGLYDGEGADTHLLAVPVGLHLPYGIEAGAELRRVLDLRTGVLYESGRCDAGPLRAVRFTSLARPGVMAMRAVCPDGRAGPLVVPATGGDSVADGTDGDVVWMTAAAHPPGGVTVAAHEVVTSVAGETVRDRTVAHDVDVYEVPPPDGAVRQVRAVAAEGFDRLLSEHRERWAGRWEEADIVVEGDDALQLATRFALFHLMASVPDVGEAAVGARGLTGEGYRGHVFWDADTFTLPFLAATHPAAARAMLEYRLARLPAAREIARSRRRKGARFPWESARSGFDVTPVSAHDRAGRLVAIRTGQLQEHIVGQIPWAANCYVEWTGDDVFARGPGLQLLVETARYWCSRLRLDPNGNAHIYGVIGPDEYHEPVDDNAFTNVMARWNLRRAADAVENTPMLAPDVGAEELLAWRRAADALVDGYDAHTGIYEQFAGFHRLEPLVIEDFTRRRPIAADLLLGSAGVRRTQVLKQADVLMMYHLLPDEVVPDTLEPNLRHYEPLTAHGSSLSPAIHASLFARARDYRRALYALRLAARVDLDDLTGTSASGMHLAAMGGLWQALTLGFAGVRPRAGRLEVDPHLPPAWGGLDVRVRFRGSRVRVRVGRATLNIHADPLAAVLVGSRPYTAGPAGLQFTRRGAEWEVTA